MGVCSSWTRQMTIMPAKESKRCNRNTGEIAVVEGFSRACRKSASNALRVTYKVRLMCQCATRLSSYIVWR